MCVVVGARVVVNDVFGDDGLRVVMVADEVDVCAFAGVRGVVRVRTYGIVVAVAVHIDDATGGTTDVVIVAYADDDGVAAVDDDGGVWAIAVVSVRDIVGVTGNG